MERTEAVTPNLRDVARAAGVHLATASRALGGSATRPVNAETMRRVQSAAERLGYQPDRHARSLRTHRTSAIGVIIPDMSNPVMPPLVRGVEQILAAAGYTTLFGDTDNDADAELQRIRLLLSWRVDGVILATARRQEPLAGELLASGLPVVLMSRRIHGASVSSVTPEEAVGVGSAMDHLTALGHTRIAYIGVPTWTSAGFERLEAFRAEVATRGLSVPPHHIVVCDGYREPDGERALERLLRDPEPPTAVLAGNDLIALGCYSAVAATGRRCPDDISIVGYADMALVDRFVPPLTTVRVPYADIGREAAALLLEELGGERAPGRSIRIAPSLIVRGSTGHPSPSRGVDRQIAGV